MDFKSCQDELSVHTLLPDYMVSCLQADVEAAGCADTLIQFY